MGKKAGKQKQQQGQQHKKAKKGQDSATFKEKSSSTAPGKLPLVSGCFDLVGMCP